MKKTILTLLIAIMAINCWAQKKLIALSFDDGPNTTTTVDMLNMLKKHKVKASFFVIGKNITPESAKIMQEVYKYGCSIENHSYTHSAMPSLSADSIKSEIAMTSALIKKYIGKDPQFFRPPYIAVNQVMYDNIELPFICGSGCDDWMPEVSAKERAERTIKNAKHGQIVLLHDMNGNKNTVDALDIIIPELKKQGFKFVTVPELFKKCKVATQRNKIYTDLL